MIKKKHLGETLRSMRYLFMLLLSFLLAGNSFSQVNDDIFRGVSNRLGSIGNTRNSDSIGFVHRDPKEDSITISYKFLDSIRIRTLDSSVNDFDKYFSVPSTWQSLGNHGAAGYSLVYTPNTKPGWDAGFHAFDGYRYTLEGTKFYRTSRPYSQLSYQIASGKEQMIKAFHTQNPRPNLNFGLDYRLISAPGLFINQNTNHKSYRFFTNYQGKRKRYAASFILVGNTLKNSENGGIKNDSLLSDPNKAERFSIPVNLAGSSPFAPNPLNASVTTGNIYKDFTLFIRQSYDIGKKDSIAINDTTTEYLFFPKLRAQHTFTYSTYSYQFLDLLADSVIYKNWYNQTLKTALDTFQLHERWKILSNDLSLLQFPDTKNPGQFLLAGIRIENITGQLNAGTKNFYNLVAHGEYRNKTRNKLWDVLLKGEFYVNGLNSGDYSAFATIGRTIDKRWGEIRLFFKNVNRTPSFIYSGLSNFNLGNTGLSSKENITIFGAEANNRFINVGFKNNLITNLAYFTDYYHTAQRATIINLLQVFASRQFKIARRINWYAEAIVQQTDGASPVKVPLLYTRNRVAFEGTYYRNMNFSTGLELRYFTPYKAYNYSPVMGQFIPQDSFKLRNLPDISAFFDFRIRGFTAYLRTENLNTISFSNGFGFTHNNFAAPHYPTPGLIIRLGIQWGFIN